MKVFTISLLAVGLAIAITPTIAAQDPCQESITLVGKDDLRWYLSDGTQANPTLTACPSTDVTFVIEVEGTQIHDFQIDETDVSVTPFGASMSPQETTWSTPASGSFTYICTVHGTPMSGTVNVASTSGGTTPTGDGGTPTNGGTDGGNGTPGFELVVVALAAIGAALILRQRRA